MNMNLEEKKAAPSPWQPMAEPLALKVLGKFLEELGECTAATSRCLIQGIDGAEPVTGKPNHEWLEDEIADVLSTLSTAIAVFGLNHDRIDERAKTKSCFISKWLEMP